MSESPQGPARRGRRSPDIAAAIEHETELQLEESDEDPEAPMIGDLLYPGAVYGIKVSTRFRVGNDDTIVVAHAADHKIEGEGDDEFYGRVGSFVLTGLMDMAGAAREQIDAANAELAAKPIRYRE